MNHAPAARRIALIAGDHALRPTLEAELDRTCWKAVDATSLSPAAFASAHCLVTLPRSVVAEGEAAGMPEARRGVGALDREAPSELALAFAAEFSSRTASDSGAVAGDGGGETGCIVFVIDLRDAQRPSSGNAFGLAQAQLRASVGPLALALAPRLRVNGIALVPARTGQAIADGAGVAAPGLPPAEDVAGALRLILACEGMTGQVISLGCPTSPLGEHQSRR